MKYPRWWIYVVALCLAICMISESTDVLPDLATLPCAIIVVAYWLHPFRI